MGEMSSKRHSWFDAETTTFGDRLTGAREAAEMSQRDLAERLGLTVKTVRGWENDRAEPRANMLARLAGLLGVSMMWLMAGRGEGPEGPGLSDEPGEEVERLLVELRQLRKDQAQLAEQTGRLESRLKLALGLQ